MLINNTQLACPLAGNLTNAVLCKFMEHQFNKSDVDSGNPACYLICLKWTGWEHVSLFWFWNLTFTVNVISLNDKNCDVFHNILGLKSELFGIYD